MPKPIIYDRSESGLGPAIDSYKYGGLGQITAITIHHSAGPRAVNKATAQRLNRQYQLDHMTNPLKRWGDIGYHFCMDDQGRLYRLRPIGAKGAHVGGWNTGNVGIMIHGNYDIHELTAAQRATIKWLFRGGIRVLTGVSEYNLRLARGHQEWPGHESNACPGRNLMRHWRWRRSVDFK